jgi:hypothetical protein
LAQAFLREYWYKRLELAQLLGQLGVLLTWAHNPAPASAAAGGVAAENQMATVDPG